MSAVATAMFLVAMTGVTLVVRQQRDLDPLQLQQSIPHRYQERFLDYDDHVRFSGLGTEQVDTVPDPHNPRYYHYAHAKRELTPAAADPALDETGTADAGDDEETRVRRSLYDSASYVPQYVNATGWFRIENDIPAADANLGGGSIDHEKRDYVRQSLKTLARIHQTFPNFLKFLSTFKLWKM
uniref:Uncharacterized protein n=1 Tax=Anopheles culicifacies TaxID=139723 RepID=A0A182M4U2_9DIPT